MINLIPNFLAGGVIFAVLLIVFRFAERISGQNNKPTTPKPCPFETATMQTLSGGENIITLGDGRRFIGSSTVWTSYPGFKRMPTHLEDDLSEIWSREKFKERYPGRLETSRQLEELKR